MSSWHNQTPLLMVAFTLCWQAEIAAQVTGAAPAAQESAADQVAWLKAHAVAVRTIDPDDDDFADLQPLKEQIGTARVVALGEQSHGDGATFLAKHRLIRFLHREMGFDVLAWESGMFDCRLVDAAMRAGGDPQEAAGLGIFPIFCDSGQIAPVFEYVRKTWGQGRPLEIAGFDCQFSGQGAVPGFGPFIRAFVERATPTAWSKEEAAAALEAVEGLMTQFWKPQDENATSQPSEHRAAVARLVSLLEERAERLQRCCSPREIAFVNRVLGNLLVYDEMRHQPADQSTRGQTNLRDQRMGENLAWLAQVYYPDRKIIVWAASFHLLRNAPTVKVIDGSLNYDGVVTMGHVAHEQLKDGYYSIMFTAYEGTGGNPWGKYPVGQAPAGSLEDLLQTAGLQYGFLDLRAPGRAKAPTWLVGRELAARPLGYKPMQSNWTQAFDGVLFTRTMFPSTGDGEVPDGVLTAKIQSSAPVGPDAVAAALERLREVLVTYGFDGLSATARESPKAPDPERMKDFPTRVAWPSVQGQVVHQPRDYKFVGGTGAGLTPWTRSLAVYEPLSGEVAMEKGGTGVLLRGVETNGVLATASDGVVICLGPMAGTLFFTNNSVLLIDGDLPGRVISRGYFNAVITGKVTGQIKLEAPSLVYIRGRLEETGTLSLKAGRVVISGRTTRADLARVSGTGDVYLEDSDLPAGEQKIGDLTVRVGQLGK